MQFRKYFIFIMCKYYIVNFYTFILEELNWISPLLYKSLCMHSCIYIYLTWLYIICVLCIYLLFYVIGENVKSFVKLYWHYIQIYHIILLKVFSILYVYIKILCAQYIALWSRDILFISDLFKINNNFIIKTVIYVYYFKIIQIQFIEIQNLLISHKCWVIYPSVLI